MKGKVKWFNHTKGYGFIIGEDEKEYFFHHEQLPKELRVAEGDCVVFEATTTEKGNQAIQVDLDSEK